MKTFELKVQQKVSVWQEISVNVEATSVEEAVASIGAMGSIEQVMVEYSERGEDYLFSSLQNLHDTEEELTPEDNGGQPTFEVYVGDRPMYKNGE